MQYSLSVAVVGYGCRFPGGANDPNRFWELLSNCETAVRPIPDNRINSCGQCQNVETRAGYLDGYDFSTFDHHFFDTTTAEAESLDPQQRMLLEVAQETLECAAIPPRSLKGKPVGVYAGLCNADFQFIRFWSQPHDALNVYSGMGSASCSASGRISRFYGFHGPSMTVDTACSSSLVAVHQACLGLRNGDCVLALAGGVNALLAPQMTGYLAKLGVLSTKGRSLAFSDESDGYVRAEGCGLLALKRLDDAVRDGDRIFGVIRGSSVNHDGESSSFTAPNAEAQVRLIRSALERSGLSAEDIDYVEAHGTGTPLGDLTEIQALSTVFNNLKRESKVFFGSVKNNIGHLESAAGVAGAIKALLCLRHKKLPAHLKGERLNSKVDWNECPLQPVSEMMEWSNGSTVRRAGVSSFGLTGTNAHVIFEEYKEIAAQTASGKPLSPVPLVISAKSESALRELAVNYCASLEKCGCNIGDLCYTAAVGRDHYSYRLAVVGGTAESVRSAMQGFVDGASSDAIFYGSASTSVSGSNTTAVSFDALWSQARAAKDVEAWFRGQKPATMRITFEKPLAGIPEPDRAARVFCRFYVSGAVVDWNGLFGDTLFQKTDLPLYPFQRVRFDVSHSQIRQAEDQHTNVAQPLPDRLQWNEIILQLAASVVNLPIGVIKLDVPLSDQGFDSLLGQALRDQLEIRFHTSLPSSFFYNFPTIESMAHGLERYIQPEPAAQERPVVQAKRTADNEETGDPFPGDWMMDDVSPEGEEFEFLDEMSGDDLADFIGNELKSMETRD